MAEVNLGLLGVGDSGGGQKRSLWEERKCTEVDAVGFFCSVFGDGGGRETGSSKVMQYVSLIVKELCS